MHYPKSMQAYQRPWDMLTDDTWMHIIGRLRFHDKLRMQQTCRRFHDMLAYPASATLWGKVRLPAPQCKDDTSSDVCQLSRWLQRRVKGISAVSYRHSTEGTQQRLGSTMVWHALVASTMGTGIRLKLVSKICPRMAVLSPPSRPELVQRLTALTIRVSRADDMAVVCSLTALRHLQLAIHPDGPDERLLDAIADGRTWECQLAQLRTLQLICMPPAAFFLPGTAACLQQLHSLAVSECLVPGGVLPSDMLRLQSLSRLELLQPPLRMMPDLRRLPALRVLLMSRVSNELDLDVSRAECSAELRDALRINPLGGAMGLTKAVLHAIPVATQECAEAIARLPHLKVLGLDFAVSVEGAFWAAVVQHRMLGRCTVESASKFVTDFGEIVHQPISTWPEDDW